MRIITTLREKNNKKNTTPTNTGTLKIGSKFYERTFVVFQKLYMYKFELVLMTGLHSCQNLRSIFNLVFTCKGINQFSL